MKKFFFILIATFFSSLLFAYPITPRPLRKLIVESEYIVWAKVIKIGSQKQKNKKENFWETEYALLQIKELIQGKLNDSLIKVYFSSGMICPAPGVFFEGEEVLTFLDKREKMEGFWVHALSYGVKHGLGEVEYKIYKDRIKEMQELIDEEESNETEEKKLEWLVKCAENSVTRWEGVYELSPQSDFMSFYDREGSIRKDIFLNTSQRLRLYNALVNSDLLKYPELGLIDIVKGVNDSVILNILKRGLLNVEKKYLWHAHEIMGKIIWFTGDDELEKLMEKFEKVYFSYDQKGKKEADDLLLLFVEKMKSVEIKQKLIASDNNNS